MNRILYAFTTLSALCFASCAGTYDIKGTSNDSNLEESKIYLTVLHNNEPKNIDSCEVVHGQFHFDGPVDSVRVAMIGQLPVVLEEGEITVKDDNTQSSATGTPLNDKLTNFMRKYQQIINQYSELQRRPYQAMMNGEDMNSVQMEVEKKSNELNDKMDRLLTGFVTENFDNVLGPWVFLNACSMRFNGTPMTDAWVEEIMSRATPKFKNNPMVKDYYRKAQENERIMNGTEQDPNVQGPQLAPPTPRQMAQPADSAAR
ncbi:MAG: DUF4369 domain-containing protein [Prevotella sp.]